MKPEVMETVLSEILEEQKQLNQKHALYTSILMDLDDKINSQEKSFSQLYERLKLVQTACESVPEQFSFPVKEINELKLSLDIHKVQLQKPIQQQVIHHVSKIWIVNAVVFVAITVLIYFLLAANGNLQQYNANDSKYRHLKLTNSNTLRQVLMYTDSLYIMNPDSFKMVVCLQEQQKQLQLDLLQQAVKKEQEAKNLRMEAREKQ